MSTAVATLRRAAPLLRLRIPAKRFVIGGVLLLVVLAAGYRFYLRDSNLVAVSAVRVKGIDTNVPGSDTLRAEIESAAEDMTTLHVQPELLSKAVGDNPLVKSISATADFPHRLTVSIVERHPSSIVGSGSAAVVVADDGVLLPALPAKEMELPSISSKHPPTGGHLNGHTLENARVLGAAPPAFLRYLDTASYGDNGVTVQLTNGIELRFGTASDIGRKWAAAAGVLADPNLTELDYVDLSAANRPSVGGTGHSLAPSP